MLNRKLTREEIEKLDLAENERSLCLMILDLGGNVVITKETKDGYDFNFVITPEKHS